MLFFFSFLLSWTVLIKHWAFVCFIWQDMVWPISCSADNRRDWKNNSRRVTPGLNPTRQQRRNNGTRTYGQTKAQTHMQEHTRMQKKKMGGCVHVFCKLCILCILLAILGITRDVYYLRDKGTLCQDSGSAKEFAARYLCVFETCSRAHTPSPPLPSPWSNFLSRLSLGSLHSTGASSSWGGVPFSIKNSLHLAFLKHQPPPPFQ